MRIKKRAFLALVPILLLALGVYLGIQFIAGLWSAPAPPLPAISIEAIYPGASAGVIAETVAAPIELQLHGVEQMVSMRSRCGSDGRFTLTATFQRGAELDLAHILVQNRVALALPMLPDAVQHQGIVVKKKSPGFLLIVNLSSPDGRRDQIFLSNYAALSVKDELTRLAGVSDVVMVGQADQRTRIEFDLKQLSAHDLTINDAVQAIREQNGAVAIGLAGNNNPRPLIPDLERVRETIVKVGPDRRILRLKDVARLDAGVKERSTARFNAKPVVALFVYVHAQADVRGLKADLEEHLANMRGRLPPGLALDIGLDFTTNLNRTPGFDDLWVDVNVPAGAGRASALGALKRSARVVSAMEPVRDVLDLSGPPFAPDDEQGCMLVRLTSADHSDADRAKIMQNMRARVADEVPAATFRLRALAGARRLPPGNYPVHLALRGPESKKVREFAATLFDRLRTSPKLTDVFLNPESMPSGQLAADIDRTKMAERGVSLEKITETLAVCLGAPPTVEFEHIDLRCSPEIGAGKNVLPQAAEIGTARVRGNGGASFPLAEMVQVREIPSARVIHRLDFLPMEEITANPAPDVSLAEARSHCESLAEAIRQELGLAPEYRLVWP